MRDCTIHYEFEEIRQRQILREALCLDGPSEYPQEILRETMQLGFRKSDGNNIVKFRRKRHPGVIQSYPPRRNRDV